MADLPDIPPIGECQPPKGELRPSPSLSQSPRRGEFLRRDSGKVYGRGEPMTGAAKNWIAGGKKMGNALKRLRLQHGWTHEEAAAHMGVSRGQFIKLERGERKLTERTIRLAAKAFEVSMAEVMRDNGPPGAGYLPVTALGERDLPVFAAAEGGPGEMVVSTSPIEIVARPWYLGSVKEGFGVLVVGESMSPAFEPGDIAVVNPRLPPARGKDVILVAREEEGEFTAVIKRLVRWTATEWHVRQFNPPPGAKEDMVLSRKAWPKALRVVGKFYG